MGKNSKKKNIIEYGLIIALYYVTGGAFSYTNYSTQIIVFFCITLCLCFGMGYQHYLLRRNVFFVWVLMSFFIIIVPFLYQDSFATYLAIIMQISIGLFCASIISPDSFKKKYINVIVTFAFISLICFSVGLIMPSIALQFPVTIGDASVDYYNAGVYVFMRSKGYAQDAIVLMGRNAGICWEPGCYQCFLNIALLFLLDREQSHYQDKFLLKFFILIVTIITTVSTTGILILTILLVLYHRSWASRLKKGWWLIPIVLITMSWLYNNTSMGTLMQTKIGREFGSDNGFLNRISLDKIGYWFSPIGIPYFFGMSFGKFLSYNQSLWNSIIHSLICLGVPFTTFQLIGYWKGGKVLIHKKGILFLIMIMCASTETLFWRVFFNTIVFYGWINRSDRK